MFLDRLSPIYENEIEEWNEVKLELKNEFNNFLWYPSSGYTNSEIFKNFYVILWYNNDMGILRYNKLIKESIEELEQLLRKERDVRIYRRIKVIYLLKKTPNVQLKDISERMEISIQSAKKYWGLYRKGGIENLKLNYKGRIPRLKKEEFEKFKEKAKEGFDSLKGMQEWIKKEFKKELSIKTISYWCKKLGIKKKGADLQI